MQASPQAARSYMSALMGHDLHKIADTREFDTAQAKVAAMLEYLETTFECETGWEDRYEDWYYNGEMTTWRRVAFPRDRTVIFKFVEDRAMSCCVVGLAPVRIVYELQDFVDFVDLVSELAVD